MVQLVFVCLSLGNMEIREKSGKHICDEKVREIYEKL